MADFGTHDRRARAAANKNPGSPAKRVQVFVPEEAKAAWDRICNEWGQPGRVVLMALIEALDKDADLRGEIARIFERQEWETTWTTYDNTQGENNA